jgi:RHS repeat-associated protein
MLDLVQEYTGHPYDQVLDIYYARARMYDADARRFMAVDPVEGDVRGPQTMVQYTYCLDNPIIFVDPFGKAALPPSITNPANIKDGFFDPNYFVVVDGRLYVGLQDGFFSVYKDPALGDNKASLEHNADLTSMIFSIGSGTNMLKIRFADYNKLFPGDLHGDRLGGSFKAGVNDKNSVWLDDKGKTKKFTPQVYSYVEPAVGDINLWMWSNTNMQRFLVVRDNKPPNYLKLLVDFEYFNKLICLALGEQYLPKIQPGEWFNSNNLIWPTNTFENQEEWTMGADKMFDDRGGAHTGIDINDSAGTIVKAVASGVVFEAINSNATTGLGTRVKIRHDARYTTVYGHMVYNSLTVSNGQVVLQGTKIGIEGSTGRSTGRHLHFEVHQDGIAVDPLNYLPGGQAVKAHFKR